MALPAAHCHTRSAFRTAAVRVRHGEMFLMFLCLASNFRNINNAMITIGRTAIVMRV